MNVYPIVLCIWIFYTSPLCLLCSTSNPKQCLFMSDILRQLTLPESALEPPSNNTPLLSSVEYILSTLYSLFSPVYTLYTLYSLYTPSILCLGHGRTKPEGGSLLAADKENPLLEYRLNID